MSIHRIKLNPESPEITHGLPYQIGQTDWVARIIPQGSGLIDPVHEFIFSRKGRAQYIGVLNPDYNPDKDLPAEITITLWRVQFNTGHVRAVPRHKDVPLIEIEVDIFPAEPKLVKPSDALDGHL